MLMPYVLESYMLYFGSVHNLFATLVAKHGPAVWNQHIAFPLILRVCVHVSLHGNVGRRAKSAFLCHVLPLELLNSTTCRDPAGWSNAVLQLFRGLPALAVGGRRKLL